MATTNEDVCNIALSRIGVSSNPISDLTTDGSAEADMCNLHLTPVIKRIMRQHDWPFTKAYVRPTLVVAASPSLTWASDYSYTYRYPANCLRIRRLVGGGRRSTTRRPYEIGSDATGRLIYCDIDDDDIIVEYTLANATNLDPDNWHPDFLSVVAWLLAYELAIALEVEQKYADRALQMFRLELTEAARNAGNEAEAEDDPDSEFIRARE